MDLGWHTCVTYLHIKFEYYIFLRTIESSANSIFELRTSGRYSNWINIIAGGRDLKLWRHILFDILPMCVLVVCMERGRFFVWRVDRLYSYPWVGWVQYQHPADRGRGRRWACARLFEMWNKAMGFDCEWRGGVRRH